jgi:ATP-binding protein involved in chromosome partitioning
MSAESKTSRAGSLPGLDNIKQIIAVASGKGGVGKSTVAVNLAVALNQAGASVGLLDADIYGPSQVGMLGSQGVEPDTGENYLYPVDRHGVSFVSMGLLTGDDTPVIWRAPIAMKMIHQFLKGVVWGELDYLLIDLPPGTGDVQLTLAQQAQLTGAVIVTTPQEVALNVARKGLRMFEQVNVPIVGVIENMSGFVCAHCGEETPIFNAGGGEQMARDMNVPFLGSLPLDPAIMRSGEDGVPVLKATGESKAARAILKVADRVKEELSRVSADGEDRPSQYRLDENGRLALKWSDGLTANLEPYNLRLSCPCALCVDEDTGRRTLDPKSIPLDVVVTGVEAVGNYAVSLDFTDGHNTGIYKWKYLRQLAQAAQNQDKNTFSI